MMGVWRTGLVVAVILMSVENISAAGRADKLKFGEGGKVETTVGAQRVADFPTTNTAYTVGHRYRTLFQLELHRMEEFHFDFNLGEQFLGGSLGYTMGNTGIGNVSVLGGYGFDLDRDEFEFFGGLSHRSTLLGIGQIKTFNGWDVLTGRLRNGLAYELYEWDDYHINLDIVGTTQILGRRNFLGFGLGYDWFEGAGGTKGRNLEMDFGLFAGYDFDERRSNGEKGDWGGGLMWNARF